MQHSTPPGNLRPFGIKTAPPDSLTMIQQTKEKMVITMENNFNQNIPVPEEPTQDTCQDASQETTAQAAPETAPKPPIKVRRVGTSALA